jgi:hypothetical protein
MAPRGVGAILGPESDAYTRLAGLFGFRPAAYPEGRGPEAEGRGALDERPGRLGDRRIGP